MSQNVKLGIFGQFLVQNISLRFCTKTLKDTSGLIRLMDICAKSEMDRSRGFLSYRANSDPLRTIQAKWAPEFRVMWSLGLFVLNYKRLLNIFASLAMRKLEIFPFITMGKRLQDFKWNGFLHWSIGIWINMLTSELEEKLLKGNWEIVIFVKIP